MSDEQSEPHPPPVVGSASPKPQGDGAAASEDNPTATPRPASTRRARQGIVWLTAMLLLAAAGVAASPFWAPQIAPLLPWAAPATGVDLGAIEARIAALERRSAAPAPDLTEIRQSESTLARRIDQIERATGADPQIANAMASIQAGAQQLGQRVGALEAETGSRAANATAELQTLRGDLARLADRLTALEREVQSQAGVDRSGAARLALLLQMRAAIDAGRPFNAEYDAFHSLVQGQPDLAAAAEPLGAAAPAGVATRSVLAERLHRLAGHIATATAAPSDWRTAALARMRALVTIRHIGGAAQSAPEAGVEAAETALARGDLAGAVGALDALAGANGEAAEPWLQMAHARLAVEAALDHLQQMLTARLGAEPVKPS